MTDTGYIQDANGVYWNRDAQTGAWQYWDGTKWLPYVPVPAGTEQTPRGRRLDYRDRSGTYWRFFAGETQWERYDGTRWVTSADPPRGSVGTFNPLSPGGKRRNQRLMFAVGAVFGSLMIWLSIVTRMPGEFLVGVFFWVLALVAAVNSLRRPQSP